MSAANRETDHKTAPFDERAPDQGHGALLPGCDQDCHQCHHATAGCTDLTSPDALHGARLVGTAASVFLLPVLLAIVLATLAGDDMTRQTLGAMLGLIAGAVIGVALRRVIAVTRGTEA